jgi:hypothetical protein
MNIMNRFIKIFFAFFILLNVFKLNAQDSLKSNMVTVQPKVMVLPFTKEGQDIRTILEADINKRVALTKVKEKFDLRGFTTVDFLGKLKAAKESNVFTNESQSDLKSTLILFSGADIYVTTEIDYQQSSSGNSITLVLTAFEVSTGNSLSNKVGFSGKFYTDDVAKLASRAVDNCIEEFLNVMQDKFTDIVKNGRSIIVDIGFAQDSKNNFSSEFSGLPLSDAVEEWFGKNAFKNNYHIQGTTSKRMILDDVKIPLKDPETGANYNPNKFALAIYKYFRDLKLETTKDIKGGTIYITIK